LVDWWNNISETKRMDRKILLPEMLKGLHDHVVDIIGQSLRHMRNLFIHVFRAEIRYTALA